LAHSPADALQQLKAEGFSQVIVGGGVKTNSSFLERGLIDEIILDIEPFLFKKGLPLTNEMVADYRLELLEIEKYASHAVGL
jgi:dihydrofolate reductase